MKETTAVLLITVLSGCASVVNHTTQQIPVTSEPSGAAVYVDCGDVKNDPKLVTPAVVTVGLIVDAANGAMYKRTPDKVQVTLK